MTKPFFFNDNPLFYIEKGGIIVKLTVELPNKTMFWSLETITSSPFFV